MNTNNELNSLKKKTVYNLTKFTSVDYPNKLACIVWFTSCNMKCLYCYNDNIVYAKEGSLSPLEVLEFLETRVGLLDGVVLSGGEATVHELKKFCKRIKRLGFLIKLDTNGSHPEVVKSLIEERLIDYIALDFKAPKFKFEKLTKSSKYEQFIETLEYLIEIDFDFEVRTTIHPDLINLFDINSMIYLLKSKGYKHTYYLQNFLETESNIGSIQGSLNSIDRKRILSRGLTIDWRN